MEDRDSTDLSWMPPVHVNTFALPEDEVLRTVYEVYKCSQESQKLPGEHGRILFAEKFIENPNLGTLTDLCIRELARSGQIELMKYFSAGPLAKRVHANSLSVDLPLAEAYHIADEQYWRRVVLAKTEDKAMNFVRVHNWKNHGVALKYVELVEECPAEYWPEEEMIALAELIKPCVKQLHVHKLQTQRDRTFLQYIEPGSSDTEEEVETSSMESYEASSEKSDNSEAVEKTEDELRWAQQERELLEERRAAWRERRDGKLQRAAEREARRKRHEARRRQSDPMPEPTKVKKQKTLKIKSILDYPIEEESDEGEADKLDKRNIEKLLDRLTKYEYPPDHCHHIDLSFIRVFENMTTFSIQFGAPKMEQYHTKYFNFSFEDIKRLAKGLSVLHGLKVFRLRKSRMNAHKLSHLIKTLVKLESIEVVDFGHDQLQEDCHTLHEILRGTTTIKSLELEGNYFGKEVMCSLASALASYEGKLEYLGLAQNPLGNDGMRCITNAILGTQHVSHLNLSAVEIGQECIVDGIAKLIRGHPPLEQLDLIAIPMGAKASVALITALQTNKNITSMDIRACDMEFDIELDIEIILRRNRYCKENPFIGDTTKTEEEVTEFCNRVKHPVMLEVMARMDARVSCNANRPPDPERYTIVPETKLVGADDESMASGSLAEKDESYSEYSLGGRLTTYMSYVDFYDDAAHKAVPYTFDANNLTVDEFHRHINIPGPDERYYYFKKAEQRDQFKYDDDEYRYSSIGGGNL